MGPIKGPRNVDFLDKANTRDLNLEKIVSFIRNRSDIYFFSKNSIYAFLQRKHCYYIFFKLQH